MIEADERKQVWHSLNDSEYRHQFVDEEINVGIAFQIRSLRGKQELTQTKLAELLGSNSNQPMISEWENPNYGNYTLATLKDLAKAFDVGLLVRFVPFSKLVDWTVDLTSDVIAPPNFSEEQSCALTPVLGAWDKIEEVENKDANNVREFYANLVPSKTAAKAEKGVPIHA